MSRLVLNINGKQYELDSDGRLEIYNKEGYSVVRHDGRTEALRYGEHIKSRKDGVSPIEIANLGNSMVVTISNFAKSRFEGLEEQINPGESSEIDIPKVGTRNFNIIARNESEEIEIGINATWNKSSLSDIYDLGSDICTEKVTGKLKQLFDSIDGIEEIEDGRGVTRKAYEIQDGSGIDMVGFEHGNVVKVALDKQGAKANEREFQAWQVVKQKPKLKKYFCPLIHHGCNFKYVVMEYAEPFKNKRDLNIIDRFEREIRRNVDNEKIDTPVSQGLDIYKDNVGRYEGRVVLIDYPYGGKFLKQDVKTSRMFKKTMNHLSE